jgi:squalene-hopene/tetraprenyl-beta-curcumene cyclase
MIRRTMILCAWALPWVASSLAMADESRARAPVTLANVEEPAANSPDEPIARQFSVDKARHFLDSAALAWQSQQDCMTCHTNYLYLLARPALGADDPAHRTVRQYAEDLVTKTWKEHGPRWDAEVVMTALVLAFNDRITSSKLHPTTLTALDRMWQVQHADGGFEWIKCDWPPFENDNEFGATMAALAISVAPGDYARQPAAREGIARLKKYFLETPMPTLHHRAMLLWADTYMPGWLSEGDRKRCVDELLSLQHEDGGWSSATLGDWKRSDGAPQDTKTSDGYATGLVIYLSRRANVAASDSRLVRGVGWLQSNQRESGRWFTRSLHKDSKHYLTHAGSNLAVMALDACNALK